AALVATIRRRSRMAHRSASNARAKRIASAVDVHGKGALATVKEKLRGADAVRSFVKARAVTVYVPGLKPSIVNCDSRDSFCLIDCPLPSTSVNAYWNCSGNVRLLIAVTSSNKLFCGYSRFNPACSSDGACTRLLRIRVADNDGSRRPGSYRAIPRFVPIRTTSLPSALRSGWTAKTLCDGKPCSESSSDTTGPTTGSSRIRNKPFPRVPHQSSFVFSDWIVNR